MKSEGNTSKLPVRRGIQVIARVADILRCLANEREGLSLGQLAKSVGLPRSTVQRIVDALAAEQFVTTVTPAGGVSLGPALVRLASTVKFDIVESARPYLKALSEKTGETVDLSVYRQTQVVFIDQIIGSHRLRAVSAIGVAFPLHCSANGKSMLAALDPAELRKQKKQQLTRVTPKTITSWISLMKEIERVRAEGIAYDREEHTLGICAVGTAFLGPNGELFAMSIPTPTHRFVGREIELSRILGECRHEIIRKIGGSNPAQFRSEDADSVLAQQGGVRRDMKMSRAAVASRRG